MKLSKVTLEGESGATAKSCRVACIAPSSWTLNKRTIRDDKVRTRFSECAEDSDNAAIKTHESNFDVRLVIEVASNEVLSVEIIIFTKILCISTAIMRLSLAHGELNRPDQRNVGSVAVEDAMFNSTHTC